MLPGRRGRGICHGRRSREVPDHLDWLFDDPFDDAHLLFAVGFAGLLCRPLYPHIRVDERKAAGSAADEVASCIGCRTSIADRVDPGARVTEPNHQDVSTGRLGSNAAGSVVAGGGSRRSSRYPLKRGGDACVATFSRRGGRCRRARRACSTRCALRIGRCADERSSGQSRNYEMGLHDRFSCCDWSVSALQNVMSTCKVTYTIISSLSSPSESNTPC